MRLGTIAAFVFSLVVQVGVPLTAIMILRRRTRAQWPLVVYGALVFGLFQMFTWLPASVYLDALVGLRLTTAGGQFVWMLTLALTASLVEEAGRLWGYRYLFARRGYRLTWQNGVAFSLGHAAMETVVLMAGLTLVYLLAYIILSRVDPAVLAASLQADATPTVLDNLAGIIETRWDQPLIVALERVLALAHHVAWGLLVMQSLVSRQKRWFGFAVLYHWSVAVIVPGLARLAGFAIAEAANVALASFSLWLILRLRDINGD